MYSKKGCAMSSGNPNNIQPGQFGYSPSIPSAQTCPYSHRVLYSLFFFCLVAVVCILIPLTSQFGGALFLGILVCVLLADWKGFTTLNGRIRWNKGRRLLLACLYVFLFPF